MAIFYLIAPNTFDYFLCSKLQFSETPRATVSFSEIGMSWWLVYQCREPNHRGAPLACALATATTNATGIVDRKVRPKTPPLPPLYLQWGMIWRKRNASCFRVSAVCNVLIIMRRKSWKHDREVQSGRGSKNSVSWKVEKSVYYFIHADKVTTDSSQTRETYCLFLTPWKLSIEPG